MITNTLAVRAPFSRIGKAASVPSPVIGIRNGAPSSRKLLSCETSWRRLGAWPVALMLLGGIAAAPAVGAQARSFAGLWDMTTSQGGYFSQLMTEYRPGFIEGSFKNSVASQAGTWVGTVYGRNYYGAPEQLVLKLQQPGMGLTGKGTLTLAYDGNSFSGDISEAKPDGSGAVQVTVQGRRTGPAPAGPTDGKPPKPMNP